MTVHPAHRPTVKLSHVMAGERSGGWLRWLESVPWTGMSLALAVGGLLLVVALPRSQATQRALALERMELELHRNLSELRDAIQAYRVDHAAWPGVAPRTRPGSTRAIGLFARQLLMSTDEAGRPSLAALPSHPHGPYLAGRLPVNPANGLASVLVLDPGERQPAEPDGLTGWIYDPATGTVRANCEGELHRAGVRFYDL